MGQVELNPIVLYPIPLSHLEKVDIDIIFDFKRVQISTYLNLLTRELKKLSFSQEKFIAHVIMTEFTLFVCISLFETYVKIEENLYKKCWPTLGSLI